MDRLQPNERLEVDEELVSNNGWFRLVMQGDGNLVLYRTQVGHPLWASETWDQPVTYTEMQGDGNLVAYSSQGVPHWATGTYDHPGAYAVMQDDGNFVVYDSSGAPLWATNTVVNLTSPTIAHTDANGYSYVEVSESWKELCRGLPCFAALQWPGYATDVIDVTIDGQAVVIQLWKGWCQKFLGLPFMPGGIGAEVGIYRRIPGRVRPAVLSDLPDALEAFWLRSVQPLTDSELWWPFPELGAQLQFTLINPRTNQPVFSAGPQTSYWLAKWMNEVSYARYMLDQRAQVPLPNNYVLEYTINGTTRRWPDGSTVADSFPTPGPRVTAPAACSTGPDVIDVFARGSDDACWYRRFDPEQRRWQPWISLGGVLTSDPDAFAWGNAPIAVARGTDSTLWWRRYPQTWYRIDDGITVGRPAACSTGPDVIDVFARGSDNACWYRRFDPAQRGWESWVSLGGVLTSDPDAFAWGNLPVVVARGTDGALWWRWHGAASWQRIDDGITVGRPAACSTGPDVIDVFARGSDNACWYRRFDPTQGGWQPWASLGGVLTSDPDAFAWGNLPVVLARGSDGALWWRWYGTASWQRIDAPPVG